jgi:fatty acid amide hydrolase 2
VPFTIKESLAVAGLPNTAGVVARKHIRPTVHATVVQRILDSGAITLGLTNTSEGCMWIETVDRVYGRTANAYHRGRIAGGSSGGEGAVIGSGASPFGIATDTLGSIRVPAFCNGVFGHRPSTGLLPLTGAWPPPHGVARMCSNGVLARRAEDLAPLLQSWQAPTASIPSSSTCPCTIRPSSSKGCVWFSSTVHSCPVPPVRCCVRAIERPRHLPRQERGLNASISRHCGSPGCTPRST